MTDDPLPLIGVIAKLDLKSTDVIVIKSRVVISDMVRIRIERHFRKMLDECGLANKVLVLDDFDIQVISPNEEWTAS